ncbi:MAG: hypothetical protein HY736_17435 [Verrucomicrobia bacterium]|nr:hypothetical protein [Verrucomicrobiota bacterium]
MLPDPVLLDGSTQAAEKRPEYGMLGDFELPGDENVRDGKVGGSQNGSENGEQSEKQGGGGATAQSQAQPGGKGDQQPDAAAKQGGGAEGAQDKAGQIGAGGPIAGQGDPNAKAEGMQVKDLQGENAGAGGETGQKPQQMAIGDSAMRIKPVPNAPSVVGAQPAGQTQQMEKAIGRGAVSPSGNNTNKGAEKGRVMPSGL